jgi:SMC interacting uncharacterized protein involved in chromosome segregation|tara:strand:- start:67 stop:249 length:183 start_codon:yes stop_codon:yes gene_type:complete
MNKINKTNRQIKSIEDRIHILSDRLYNPDITTSEAKKINRRKKKLLKTKEKIEKRLDKDH